MAGLSLPASSSGLSSPSLESVVSNSTASADPRYLRARVVRVIDGDTIIAMVNGEEEKIRYIGVDTPELRGHKNRKHRATKELEVYANEAKALNERLLKSGFIYLLPDRFQPGRSYDRLLYHPFTEQDGNYISIGKALLESGLAETPNFNHEYRQQFREYEGVAKEHCKGQWELECERTE